MKHWFTYPLVMYPANSQFMVGESLLRVAKAAEAAGFSGIAFTDHPAPSQKWLNAGGHDALDPFAALSFIAAATARIRLIPNIVVLPYRNPFVVAKAAATIDALSGGRFTLSVAAGYLRSEYRALGIDFEKRNELFDQALEVLRGVWEEDEFSYEGSNFTAVGVTANPKPDHLPIWIGGNSRVARRRVAQHGDGWNPFPAPAILAKTARTPALESLDDLAPMIDDLRCHLDAAHRDQASVDIAFTTCLPGPDSAAFSASAHLEAIDRMSQMGVTWNSITVPGDSIDHAIEVIERYGREVISQFHSQAEK